MSRRALTLLALLLATGCAGRDFTRPQLDDLPVGKATEAEVRQKLGTPYREGTVLKNNETMKVLGYAYATTLSSPPGDLIPARAQEFYFWRDVLVGHDFSSSFPDDRTDFDATKAQLIKKGETTEAGVEALLGKPHGSYVFPLIGDKAARATVYHYQQTKGTAFNPKFYNQILVIQYDAAGLVKALEYTATGDR
jgi:outer membrane protein assembly factor BamE (lipoprotein component of BamABCDE complex)